MLNIKQEQEIQRCRSASSLISRLKSFKNQRFSLSFQNFRCSGTLPCKLACLPSVEPSVTMPMNSLMLTIVAEFARKERIFWDLRTLKSTFAMFLNQHCFQEPFVKRNMFAELLFLFIASLASSRF